MCPLNDFPNIPEVVEYRDNPWGMRAARDDGVGSGGYLSFKPKVLADAAIAALEARVATMEAARAATFEQFLHMAKVALEQQGRAERAEAENERLKGFLASRCLLSDYNAEVRAERITPVE